MAKRAQRIDSNLKETPRGVIPFMEIFQLVIGLLGMCPKPVTPAPDSKITNPTPAQSAAWEDAWKIKCKAKQSAKDDGTYGGPAFTRTVSETLQKSRLDGQKMKRRQAVEVVTKMFADAESSSMPELYSDVLEARHAS